jgi:hypothetical protein
VGSEQFAMTAAAELEVVLLLVRCAVTSRVSFFSRKRITRCQFRFTN